MIVGIAVETTVDSNDASAVTSTSAIVTFRRRRGSKRGVHMGRDSIECRLACSRGHERVLVQGVEGKLLSRGPPGVPHALVLRRAPSHRRDQQHLLPDAEAVAARGLERGGAGVLP